MNQEFQNVNIKELSGAVSMICEEKGLDKNKVIEIIGDALAAAYKKDYGKKGQIIKANFDPSTQTASFYQIKEVVDESTRNFDEQMDQTAQLDEDALPRYNEERDIRLKEAKKFDKNIKVGEEFKIDLPPENKFGRVAAQNAKQVIIQKLREAERNNLYEEFKDKEGEVISATVQRVENRNVYLDLGKMVGVLFPGEQVPSETYRIGQRIKVYVDRVSQEFKDTTVILSRSNPKLVSKLFYLEVPEIFSGTVKIVSIAREPGSRSKMSIKSEEEGIDPIGSCVGQKGIRVQAIIDELGGEKIDIIEYNEDPKIYISQALAPAKVKFVEIDEKEKKAIVTVDPDQLSLAIGKRGQNVRLAAKLTGWKIDVLTEEDSQAQEEVASGKEDSEEPKEDQNEEKNDQSAGKDKKKNNKKKDEKTKKEKK
ncbi:MAG: transcription termination/antitermination protein NusA [Candidatus Moranbacteria bacterium]|nr:transcription termination/antitermination protein NusA [Candidatus Moranbacteria bacterium]